jgi:hypothetical protein
MRSVSVRWPIRPPRPFVLVLGTNEIASAVAVTLTGAGSAVVMSHDPYPPVIRRGMAFHDVLFGEAREVEGVAAQRADTMAEIARIHDDPGKVVVTELHLTDVIALRSPTVIVDARMQKHRATPDLRGIARVTVGLGPHFEVGANCDIAIETHPCETGALVTTGATLPADGKARNLGGAGRERFVYAAHEAIWHTPVDIGARIYKGLQLGSLGGQPVLAPIDGTLRGIVRDGARVPAGVKLLEIDPRGRGASWTGMDARGRAIAAGVSGAVRRMLDAKRALSLVPANMT